MLLFRDRNAFGSRSEPPQQRIDSDRDDAEHRDLAERVERAEVDQDDVHDVGAATPRIGVLDKEASDALRRRARHDYEGERRQPRSCRDGDGEVTNAIPSDRARRRAVGANLVDPLRKPTQPEQQQYGSDRLYDQLRQREIRRGQPDKADTGHQTGAPEQDERRKAMELGLIGRRQGAGDSDGPDHSEHEIESCGHRAFDPDSARVERNRTHQQCRTDQQLQLRLQPTPCRGAPPAALRRARTV